MHNQLILEIKIKLELSIPQGSLLLLGMKEDEKKPTTPVKSGGQFYIPGSSLKGTFRNQAEFIATHISQDKCCCHIFDKINNDPNPSCSERIKSLKKVKLHFSEDEIDKMNDQICPSCLLFGHAFHKGIIGFNDFIAVDGTTSEIHRPGLAIDRVVGCVAQDPKNHKGKTFRTHYLSEGIFCGNITITNFSFWQLGWLGLILKDLDDGFFGVGHNQNLNIGRLNIKNASAIIRNYKKPKNKNNIEDYLGQFNNSEDGFSITTESHWKKIGFYHEVYVENKNHLFQIFQQCCEKTTDYFKFKNQDTLLPIVINNIDLVKD
ncbi:MAG: hypothetical protein CL609_23280 [Anaerolineaceae bacterium]|nr:hypothetical protein [Anaerolineaceae bacterium]